jgi:hypothetical protein
MRLRLRHENKILLGRLALCVSVSLTGCATIESAGTVTTRQGQPFPLTGGGQRLLIEPGPMAIEIGERPPPLALFHSHITVKTRRGALTAKTYAGDFAADTLTVRGASRGLSADLAARWTDLPAGIERESTSRECSYAGWCVKAVDILRCPDASYEEGTRGFRKHRKAPECHTVTKYRDGYYSDCPGRQRILTTYEKYRRQYQVDFLSAQPGVEPLGQYQGLSALRRRQIDEEELEPCH